MILNRLYAKVTEDNITKKAIYVIKIENEKDKNLFPEDVAYEIIKYLKENAEEYLKKIFHKNIK